MNVISTAKGIRSALLFFSLVWGILPAVADDSAMARDLFEQLNARYDQLSAWSYTVVRTTAAADKSVEEKWDFRFKAPNFMKIEYYSPVHRIIVMNESTLWEYIPAAKKAVRTDLAALPQTERTELLASVMARVAVDGLRVGDTSKMIPAVTKLSQGDDNMCTVEGRNPNFTVRADRSRMVLLHSEFRDEKGGLVMQTDASNFQEVQPGFWCPQKIVAVRKSDKGLLRSEIVLKNVRANDNPPDSLFEFAPPDGVAVSRR